MFFYWRNKFSDNRKTFPKIKGTYLEKIPLVIASDEIKLIIINLVDQIITNKRISNPTIDLEAEIDLIVFKLYELTFSEVKIIDLDFSLNEDEYNEFIV